MFWFFLVHWNIWFWCFSIKFYVFVLWTLTLFDTNYFTKYIFNPFNHAVTVTGPADAEPPPPVSVILDVVPVAKV